MGKTPTQIKLTLSVFAGAFSMAARELNNGLHIKSAAIKEATK
ncbi:hypothetical protein [Undibacterium sp.]